MTIIKQSVKLRPNGFLSWSRHVKLTVVQSHYRYSNYPMDDHSMLLRFSSVAYSVDFLRILLNDDAVTFINAAYPNHNSDVNWELNNQWVLNQNKYRTYTYKEVRNISIPEVSIPSSNLSSKATPGLSSISSTFEYGIVILEKERISQGVLIRLGMPILILMILSGLVFWAAVEKRIYATMKILFAVATLYIVVFGEIPMLGYITNFDEFIVIMFIILTLASALHQFIHRVNEKAGRRPLRYIVSR